MNESVDQPVMSLRLVRVVSGRCAQPCGVKLRLHLSSAQATGKILCHHMQVHLTADAPTQLRMCMDAYAMMLNNSMCAHLA